MEGEARPQCFSLTLHETIKSCQNQNGLRHGDYQRYRQYCTRRLKRVRSARDVRFMFGKGKAFVPRELTPEDVTTENHLVIPLMTAERAWACAMHLKQDAASAPYRVTHRLVRRLAKAAQWAKQLEALCLETADERTCLEASAYAAWMAGNHLLEKEAWKAALEQLSTAHRICRELGQVGSIEDQDLFTQRAEEIEPSVRYCTYNLDLSSDDAEAQLVEMSRQKDSGKNSTLLAAKLEHVLAEARNKQAQGLESVEWRGRRVGLPSESLRVSLIKARELSTELLASGQVAGTEAGGVEAGTGTGAGPAVPTEGPLANGNDQQYLKVFEAWDEVTKVATAEAQKLQGKGSGAKMEAQRRDLEDLLAYAKHQKQSLVVHRNELLVERMQRGRLARGGGGGDGGVSGAGVGGDKTSIPDIVHVYDALLQCVRDMRAAVRGAGAKEDDDMDEEDEDEDEDEVVQSLRADEARFRAFRCYFMGEFYSSAEKWPQAAALFDHTERLCAEVLDLQGGGRGGGEGEGRATAQTSLRELSTLVEGARHRAAAQALLAQLREGGGDAPAAGVRGLSVSSRGGGKRARTLEQRLEEFDAGREAGGGGFRVADFPPALRPIPCKPRLLDLAQGYLQFPDLDERTGVVREEEGEAGERDAAGEGGAGIRGWVGWALGRG